MPSFQACEICGEPFEQFWDEDEEEWHLKDALRIKERTYHPVCYEDFKEVRENAQLKEMAWVLRGFVQSHI